MWLWYNNQKSWTMGTNYYVNTFVGDKDDVVPNNYKGDFYWTYHKFWKKSVTFESFMKAVRNIRKFNLLLITEWLSTATPLVDDVLGWTVPPRQVLPHEVQV
jgi:hypothetical protein